MSLWKYVLYGNLKIVIIGHESQKTSKPQPTINSVTESKQNHEDNMARVFMGIILLFLVCHLPRCILDTYALIHRDPSCKIGKDGDIRFTLWFLIMNR